MTEFKRNSKGNLKTQIGKDGEEYLIPKYQKNKTGDKKEYGRKRIFI